MISKQILITSLTLITGSTLVLQSIALHLPSTLPFEPTPLTELSTPEKIAYSGSSTRIALPSTLPTDALPQPQPQSLIPNSIPVPKVSSIISDPPVRPVKPNTPDNVYSALPFEAAESSFGAAAVETPWWLTKIQNPTTPTTGLGTLIAVIDTGFAFEHTGLAGKWYTNPAEMGVTTIEGPAPNCTSRGLVLDKSCNNFDNDANGYRSDWRGWDFSGNDNSAQAGTTNPIGGAVEHGTFVTGLISSTLTSTSGGVDANARILALQALSDDGSGTTSTVGDAIIYAAEQGAKIISLSLGSSGNDVYMQQAITYAIALGAVVVAASGNDGCDCVLYPANYPEVIAVGASTMTDTLATFSSYGANLDLIAPGQDLCSTTFTSTNSTNAYACGGAGTSFSTPIVSGALSRLLKAGASIKLVDQYLNITADKLATMNGSWRTLQHGTGRLQVTSALNSLSGPQYTSTVGGTFRKLCSGIASCSIELINVAGNQVVSVSKSPVGIAEATYADTPSAGANGTIWRVNDVNSATISYYLFKN